MRIGIREALFSGEEVDEWEPTTSRFETYDETDLFNKNWFKLVQAHPDVFKASGYIARKDGGRFRWYQLFPKEINCYPVSYNTTLGRESETYLYDPKTQSIIFNHTGKALDELEPYYPHLEKAMESKKENKVYIKDAP